MICPKCNYDRPIKAGFGIRKGGKKQKYQCTECGYTWIDNSKPESA